MRPIRLHQRAGMMCGILGGISTRPMAITADADRLDAAIDTLSHRGPDDRGRYVAADGRAFLGHRRLSIIDLTGGHQPLSDAAGRTHLCYNGEIYNYRTLRDGLLSQGRALRTNTDGEVILPLYRDDPRGFVRRLSGMFAIAILDEDARTLTLARDRNGIKPLYYYAGDETLLFASELKAILAMLPQRPVLSPEALRLYLRWKYVPDPLTIFEGIHRLPPAHMLRAFRDKDGGLIVQTEQYWRPDYGVPKIDDEAEAIERLDACLQSAVRSHLESDVEVGALLSGGVDSSLVVALAARSSKQRIKTFSVGFDESGFDQLPYARVIAERYGTEHFEEVVRLDPLATVERMVRQFDEPFADSSALACLRVCEVASRHVKVVLTGDGGDESFGGYKRYEEVMAGDEGVLRRSVNRALSLTSAAVFSPEGKFVRRLASESHPPLARHEIRQQLFSDWLARRLLAEPWRSAGCPDIFEQHRRSAGVEQWSAVEVAQYIDLRMYLPGDILTKVDRTSMACSLECRVPLLDHSVTELSAAIAPELKVRGGVRKYLLKRLAERYVPAELLYRPKMGFRIPIRRWFKRGLLEQTAELLRDGALVRSGILDERGVNWMIRSQQRAWMDFGSQLWALLFLEHWARVHL